MRGVGVENASTPFLIPQIVVSWRSIIRQEARAPFAISVCVRALHAGKPFGKWIFWGIRVESVRPEDEIFNPVFRAVFVCCEIENRAWKGEGR